VTATQATRAPAAVTAAIRTVGLVKVWPSGLRAVDGIDLAVRPGEFFGLLGPNGAGKTTTIGMLTTRVIPSDGRALVGGVDVVAHPARAKQVLGVVPQSNTLDRSITVYENLYYHGRYFAMSRREAKQRAHGFLARFRLVDKADVKVQTLSGGMAQRLMVARALMHDPDVLFLDEPTTGLDPQSRIALWDLLTELNAEGQTILLTTHYMDEADRLCDRVAIMDHGRVLACDTPAALKLRVDSDSVVNLAVARGGVPLVDAERARLAAALTDVHGVARTDAPPQIEGAEDDGGAPVRIFAKDTAGLLPRLVAAVELEGAEITDMSVSRPTLETVFIALTGRDLRE
jgi:ABC-2 type transport system ATP-binding protein